MEANIVLIGFMAVGKGLIAREVSEQTGWYAVDTDDLIESSSNMKIREIFSVHGETHFRELERRTGQWLAEQVSRTIVSTGGGFFSVPNLSEIGTVVYLHNEFDHIVEAVHRYPKAAQEIIKRPLLKDLARARALYESRLPLYRQAADLELYVGDGTTRQAAAELVRLLALG